MQEIFNKVEQNQLQRTKNVGKFLNTRQNHFRFQPEALAAESKWVVGHHPLVSGSDRVMCEITPREKGEMQWRERENKWTILAKTTWTNSGEGKPHLVVDQDQQYKITLKIEGKADRTAKV